MQRFFPWVLCLGVMTWCLGDRARGADDPNVAAVQAATEAFVKAFNAGNVKGVVGSFLPKGELIDENGTAYQGQESLTELFTKYFEKFPGATLGIEIESIRIIGENLAVEEGTRYLSSKDDSKAQVRYVTFRTKSKDGWQIASLREFYDEPPPTPKDNLAGLAWLVGDWVSEDPETAVKISYKWSEDKNFLLGDYQVTKEGLVVMKSTQRIGWDPLAGKPRSWLFDADGGFAEGSWTQADGDWVIKSQATLPEGITGSATITLTPQGKDRFTMKGTDRLSGEGWIDDFEVTVTRRPPVPKEKTSAAAPMGTLRPAGATTTPATTARPGVPATPAVPKLPSPAVPKR